MYKERLKEALNRLSVSLQKEEEGEGEIEEGVKGPADREREKTEQEKKGIEGEIDQRREKKI